MKRPEFTPYGASEAKRLGMKHQPVAVSLCVPIQRITDQGMADGFEANPQLMRPSRQRPEAQACPEWLDPDLLPEGHGHPPQRMKRIAWRLTAGPSQWAGQGTGIAERQPLAQAFIGLFDLPFLKKRT